MSNEEFKKLEQFEAHSLEKADKAFNKRDYRLAETEYDSFIKEFPRSSAMAYAVLRKARSLHLDGKRFQAIKVYDEVLDFFPNNIPYAAAALYHQGEAHNQNGDTNKAMVLWAEMANDVDYNKVPLAARAMNELGEYFQKQNQTAKAMEYYALVAINFRSRTPDAAREAMAKVIGFHVRTKPDEQKLREFYTDVKTFEHNPRTPPENPETDRRYWEHVRANVRRYGTFNDLQKDLMQSYYKYWAGVMAGKFPDWDDFQIDRINFLRNADGNPKAWEERLEKQFNDHQKEGDTARVVKWIRLFGDNKDKVAQYYQKLNFSKMPNNEIVSLVYTCLDTIKDPELAKNTFEKIHNDKMDDKERYELGRQLWERRADELFRRNCLLWTNRDAGKYQLLRYRQWQYHHWKVKEAFEEGIPLATELATVPDYAKSANMLKGHMLKEAGQYEEAIQAYTAADSPPDALFDIAECYVKMGRLEPAVAQLREVENFFNDTRKYQDAAPRASLTAAYYYRDSGNRKAYVAELRKIMKKYNTSRQSSRAHELLEAMGERIGGAVDENS